MGNSVGMGKQVCGCIFWHKPAKFDMIPGAIFHRTCTRGPQRPWGMGNHKFWNDK